MNYSFKPRPDECTLFTGQACIVKECTIVQEGAALVTDRRFVFRSRTGELSTWERAEVESVSRAKYGFLPRVVVHTQDDNELSLIAVDAWNLGEALQALSGRVGLPVHY